MDKEVSMATGSGTDRVARQPYARIPALLELPVYIVYPDRGVMEAFATPFEEPANDGFRGKRFKQLKPRRT